MGARSLAPMRRLLYIAAAAHALRIPRPRIRAPITRAAKKAPKSSTAWTDLYKPNYVSEAPLNRMQLKLALNRLGLRPSEREMSKLWGQIDTNDDGTASLSEFSDFAKASAEDDESAKIIGELRAALKTEPSWILGTLRGAKAVDVLEGDVDEIDVLREEYDAMRRAVAADHSRIIYDGSRYGRGTSRDWWRVLLSLRQSFVVRKIANPLKVLTAWALVVALGHRFVELPGPWKDGLVACFGQGRRPTAGVGSAMSLLGSALSLLLVFRTNTAYQRYWEGRGVWEKLVSSTRDAADYVALYKEEMGGPRIRRVADLLCAFPLALQLHLQGQPLRSDPKKDLARVFAALCRRAGYEPDAAELPLPTFQDQCRKDERLANIFSLPSDVDADVALSQLHALKFGVSRPKGLAVTLRELEAYYNPLALRRLLTKGAVAALAASRCAPLGIARRMAAEVKAVPYDDAGRFSSRDRLAIISKVNALRGCVGAAERIAQTPVPLHYARHTSRFLTLWSFALPLALVDSLGFLTVPATFLVCWALFGLAEIGTLIENPFSRPLQLQIVSDTLALDVREALEDMPSVLRPTAPKPKPKPPPTAPPAAPPTLVAEALPAAPPAPRPVPPPAGTLIT